MDRLGPGKKPTREPTIASCRVARCPNSFRSLTSACVSTRINATNWDFRRRCGTTKIALRIRRLQVRILPSAPKAQVRGLRPFGCARKVANNTLRVEARAPNKGRSEGSNPSGIDLRISQQCPLLEIESMAWGHGSTRERQPTFLEIQIAVGVDPVSDRTRSACIDSTARLSFRLNPRLPLKQPS